MLFKQEADVQKPDGKDVQVYKLQVGKLETKRKKGRKRKLLVMTNSESAQKLQEAGTFLKGWIRKSICVH